MDWKLIDAWAERKGIAYKTRHSWRARGVPHKHRPAIVAGTAGKVTLRMMERAAVTARHAANVRFLTSDPAVVARFNEMEDVAWDAAWSRAAAKIKQG